MPTKIVDVKTGVDKRKALPPGHKAFHVEHIDKESGLPQAGTFVVKRLNLGEIRQVAIRKAQLNGGLPEDSLSTNIVYMNGMLAHLELALTEVPEWWKPLEMFSGDIITDVYEEVMNFEDSFRGPTQQQPQGSEGDSAGQDQPSNESASAA